MLCHLSLHYLMSLFRLHHNVNDVHANMWERRGQGRESCKCVFYTKWFLSWKTSASVELLEASLWWLLSPACLTHIVWISSSAPFCSFLLQGKHSSLTFLLCKHFLVGLRKDQVPFCFLSPCCHHFRCCSHLYSQNCCSNQKRIIKISLKRVEPSLCTRLQKLESTNSYKSLTTNVFNTQRKA